MLTQTRLLMYTCPFSYNILTARVYLFQNAYPFGKNILSNKFSGFKTPSPNITAIFCSLFICILIFFVAQIAALQEQVRLLQSAQACILHICVFCEQSNLSLLTPL